MDTSNDWELLQDSLPSIHLHGAPPPLSADLHRVDGVVLPDYFTLDAHCPTSQQDTSTDSDNPIWIDPASQLLYGGGPSSNSSADDSLRLNIELNEFNFDSGLYGREDEQEILEGGSEDDYGVMDEPSDGLEQSLASAEGGKRSLVWWKLPFELLKLWGFRIGPMWSVSLAAAAVGLVILGRTLYRIKRRARSLGVDMGVDYKRVSPLKIQATRYSEALTVAKQVPVMRVLFPMPGAVTPWPVLGLML